MDRIPIDEEWFRGRLAALGLKANDIAKVIGRTKYVVSRTLHGLRPMRGEEVRPIATLLGVSVEEVLFRAGMAPRLDTRQPPIAVKGVVRGRVVRLSSGQKAAGSVVAPSPLADSVIALRIETGPAWLVGAHLLFDLASRGVNPSAIGRLAVCETPDSAELRIGRPNTTANEEGVWRVDYLDGSTDQAVRLTRATPILWIRT